MYETLMLIDPETSITDDVIYAAISKACLISGGSSPTVSCRGSTFQIAWPGFSIELGRSDLPHVLEESQEIAQEFASGKPQQNRIAQCRERIELAGDDDPAMDHFNDYCSVVEAIESLGIVYTFDQGTGEFMNL